MYEKSCLISQCAQGQIVPTKKVVTALLPSLASICNHFLLIHQLRTVNVKCTGAIMRKAFGIRLKKLSNLNKEQLSQLWCNYGESATISKNSCNSRQNVDGWSQILSIFVTNLCKKVTSNSEFYRITTFKFTNWELL